MRARAPVHFCEQIWNFRYAPAISSHLLNGILYAAAGMCAPRLALSPYQPSNRALHDPRLFGELCSAASSQPQAHSTNFKLMSRGFCSHNYTSSAIIIIIKRCYGMPKTQDARDISSAVILLAFRSKLSSFIHVNPGGSSNPMHSTDERERAKKMRSA